LIDPPRVSIELEPSTVIESSSAIVRLECVTLDGNPSQLTMVQWFMNEQHIETTYGSSDGPDGQQADLLIMANVTRTQAGNYSCQGFNGAANASQISNSKELFVQCMSISHSFILYLCCIVLYACLYPFLCDM
jgi:hypothetical protein